MIRRSILAGEQQTLQVEQENKKINDLVSRLERLQPGSAEHASVLPKVVDLLRQDVRDEGDELLAKLQSRLSPAKLRWVGNAHARTIIDRERRSRKESRDSDIEHGIAKMIERQLPRDGTCI